MFFAYELGRELEQTRWEREASVAGLDPKYISVDSIGSTVRIKFKDECVCRFLVPKYIDIASIEAKYQFGVIRLSGEVAQEKKPQSIPVQLELTELTGS